MDSEIDVLVVGAGPTGLTLAAWLREFGASVRVVDRGATRVRESRALAVQPRTLEVLRGLGVTEEMVRRGNTAVRIRMHTARGEVEIPAFGSGLRDTAFPYLLFLSQAETEEILGARLAAAGVEVERGTELTGAGEVTGGVRCTLRRSDGASEHVLARYVAGCDGARSTVRRLAGISFPGGAYPQTFLLADLEADGDLAAGVVHAWPSADGLMFLFPLGRPATWRMLAVREPVGPADPEKVTLEELQALADRRTGGTVRLRDPVWSTAFTIGHRLAKRYRRGRFFLAGDAAHVHSPAGAQGMNAGIQDAWNLGWRLGFVTGGDAGPALLDAYETERLPVGRFLLSFTDRATSAALSARPAARLARGRVLPRVLPLAARFAPGRGYAFRIVSQLTVAYRRSPDVAEGVPRLRRGPVPGARLPDLPVLRDGAYTTIQAELTGPYLHLLLCGDAGPARDAEALAARYRGVLRVHRLTRDAVPGALRDAGGHLLRRLGTGGRGVYLIRPDGHVAYRCAGDDLTGAAEYLHGLLAT
ncbi:MAG: monooxygenase [Streptosporangiales bacterium]|nr:monooxygenase [Streptosporangiales bacterium]